MKIAAIILATVLLTAIAAYFGFWYVVDLACADAWHTVEEGARCAADPRSCTWEDAELAKLKIALDDAATCEELGRIGVIDQ